MSNGLKSVTDQVSPASAHDTRQFRKSAPSVDVAAWLAGLPAPQAQRQLGKLPLPRRAVVFAHLDLPLQVEFAAKMPARDLADLVTQMDSDDRTDLFKHMDRRSQATLLENLPQSVRDDIRRLSSHEEGTAGSLMTTDFATIDARMSPQQAIEALRAQAVKREAISRPYIVDEEGVLMGSVELHQLIVAPDSAHVGDIMRRDPVSVTVDTDQEDVAKAIERYDLASIPVIHDDGRLVGIVTHDDAADAMQAATTEDFQRISTVRPFSESLRSATIGMLYSRRVFWLVLLVFGNLFSGAGISYFEDTILAYVALVFFLPLLIDSSGNAGSQSATLMVRALATGDVAMKDWGSLILRELAVAGALGLTMMLVVVPLGIWRGGYEIGLVVGLTMLTVVIIGSTVGMSLPFLLSRLRLDPATASGPLVTTISDAMGVLIYFSIATAVLDL
ncbi:magnesium transporter [Paracoccus jeotgali]|uniref:magnesium transporter n=1 Tax=Paracoccus jeotgali TaxID=2065379 RepID=UPI0028AC8C95|nr:magnesium transporter [Paracoccus jeotgali]